jgi:hypothetical protein
VFHRGAGVSHLLQQFGQLWIGAWI